VTELTAARIKTHATKLGLPHLAASLEQLVHRADTEQLGYLDFLDLIIEEELGIREGRRFRAALRQSKLPHHKTLDEFEFSFQPDLDVRKVKDLASLSFIDTKSNVALLGPPGVGKTHLAVALAVSACRAGYSIYFTSLDDMIRHLRAADELGRLIRKMRAYTRPAVLIIDEVGYLPLDRSDANLVFQIISRRYENGPIILTSNKTFSEWGQIFCDDVLATAILDRLLHHCEVLAINGPSYRLKHRLTATGGQDPHMA
jgi:DNA replication protein DnaC